MRRRPASDDPAAARERALRLLARREHSSRELQDKLRQRGFDDTPTREAIDALREAGWQSDARYAESLLRSRVAQGYGPLRIAAELEAAGVANGQIREALGTAEVDWQACAIRAWARHFRVAPQSAMEWQKQYRYLAGRGFTAAQIRASLQGEAPDA